MENITGVCLLEKKKSFVCEKLHVFKLSKCSFNIACMLNISKILTIVNSVVVFKGEQGCNETFKKEMKEDISFDIKKIGKTTFAEIKIGETFKQQALGPFS